VLRARTRACGLRESKLPTRRPDEYHLDSPIDWRATEIDCHGEELFTGAMAGNETLSEKHKRFVSVRDLFAKVSLSRRKIATGGAALLALAVGFHVVFGANGLTVYLQKRQDTLDLKAEMQRLQRENDALKGHVDRLQQDPEAIEQQAREALRYTRPGEVIYTLPTPPPTR
jgi:cell division protein FtsB